MEVISRYHFPFSLFRVAWHASACLPSVLTRQLPDLRPCSFSLQVGLLGSAIVERVYSWKWTRFKVDDDADHP